MEELIKDNMQWCWIPSGSFGQFRIGTDIRHYMSKYRLKRVETEDYVGYELDTPELLITVDDSGLIDSFNCFEVCYFKGVNLIGASYQVLMKVVGEKPFDEDTLFLESAEEYQKALTFIGSGMQVWMRMDGIVNNIICADFND